MKLKTLISAKKEGDFIKIIPSLFNEQEEGYFLILIEKDGESFQEAGSRSFSSFNKLEEETWSIPYSTSYVAMIKDSERALITFRGQDEVISYRLVRGLPILDFYKNKRKSYRVADLNEKEKRTLLEELKAFFRSLK